jgi:fucose permease
LATLAHTPAKYRTALLALAYLAFVSLGLPDAVLGVAWPSMRDGFGLSQASLGLPLAISAIAYFCSGMFAGRLMQRLGVGRLLAASTALVAFTVLGYSVAPVFGLILVAAPLVGFGSGAIDATLNTYAARSFSPRHMSWLHAAYAAGAMGGPAIMTAVLASGASWRAGYAVVGALLAALVPAFLASRGRWDAAAPVNVEPASVPREKQPNGALAALSSGRVRLQLGLFFLYSGLEVAAGQWCYTVLTEERGVGATAAGAWTAAYWGGLLAGRLVLGLAVARVGQVNLLRLAMLGAVLSAVLFALPGLPMAGAALPVLSFSLASIYPGLMSETPRRVGDGLAPHAVGFQVSAATVGVAAVPGLAGLLSEWLGLAAIGWVIAACAVVLLLLHERLVALADRPAKHVS